MRISDWSSDVCSSDLKASGEDRHVSARIVVLAASACESARLLLNSRSSRFPQGLANSSGVVGKYLTDNTGNDVAGRSEERRVGKEWVSKCRSTWSTYQ